MRKTGKRKSQLKEEVVTERRKSRRIAGTKISYAEEEMKQVVAPVKINRKSALNKEVWDVGSKYSSAKSLDTDSDGRLVSNDMADYVLVKCKLCGQNTAKTSLRSHTKAAHNVTITEYKSRFGVELEILAMVYHRCGVCSTLIILDNDSIAEHLKRGNHPRITHRNYNNAYMVDTRREG